MKYLLASEIVDAVETKHKAPLLVECPDCEFFVLAEHLYHCPDCQHIACADCMTLHVAEPHADDISNSPEAHGAWRKYDA